MRMVISVTKTNMTIHIHHYSGYYEFVQTHHTHTRTHTRDSDKLLRTAGYPVPHTQSLREPLAETHHRGAHAGQESLFAPSTPVGVLLLELDVTTVASLCDYEVTG